MKKLRGTALALGLVVACGPGETDATGGAPSGSTAEPGAVGEAVDPAASPRAGPVEQDPVDAPTRAALPRLFAIMAGLERDEARLSRGLWLADLDVIADAAAAIANHPKIPQAEAERIVAVLGPDMVRFQELDTEVHDLAVRIRTLASEEDLQGIVAADAAIREGCVTCHEEFRERLRGGIR